MSYIDEFIKEYKELYMAKKPQFDASLASKLKELRSILLNEEYSPSNELQLALSKLQIRSEEPMKVAITGQFSSGKSTFLNALLAKNILPTGITPVTSKVNYIRYGDELKIKVRYLDGREEYHSAEGIKRFTDQREEVEEVEYLTIYAPLELLKDIIFVDTPGLNSQAHTDTTTTQNVLKEVDGIIWLTLIDNAGKQSEAEVLKEYLKAYQNKSLCVLNQKDKFTKEQTEQTLSYVKTAFSEFFSQVIPISAIEALKARSHDRKNQIDALTNKLIDEIKKESISISTLLKHEEIEKKVAQFKKEAKSIYDADGKENLELLHSSNIDEVLDFIHKEIQPIANESKKYAITKDVKQICDDLIEQNRYFIQVYDELSKIITLFEKTALKTFEQLKIRFSKELQNAYIKIEQIIEKISAEIYNNITSEKRVRYASKKSTFLSHKVSYEPIEYEVSKIETDTIYKKLFFNDDVVGKMFKKYVKNLRTIQDAVNEENGIIYKKLEKSLQNWQSVYEKKRKNKPLHSDIEFANLRRFASKAYENFLKAFNDEIHSSYAQISSQFNHLSSAVSFNYQNATEVSMGFLERKIYASIKLYEENPTMFPLFVPKLDEIKERLRTTFHLYELENMMQTKNTFLNKNYDWLMSRFGKIEEEKISFLEQKSKKHLKIIEKLEEIRENF